MYIQTHVLSGWCLGNLVKLSPRERMLGILAASLPDIDGLGIVVSQDEYHQNIYAMMPLVQRAIS